MIFFLEISPLWYITTKYRFHGSLYMTYPKIFILIYKWIICSQTVYRLKQPNRDCSELFLIRGIPDFDHRDEFPMVSALVDMVTHWTIPMMSHDIIRLSISHNFTKLLRCVVSYPWENLKLMPKLVMALTYSWHCKKIIYFLWNGSLLMEVGSNRYK